MQLGPNDWPKVQEKLKTRHWAKICQTEPQIQQKEPTANIQTAAPKRFTKNKSQKSAIYPPIPKINPELNTKAKHILITLTKFEPLIKKQIHFFRNEVL